MDAVDLDRGLEGVALDDRLALLSAHGLAPHVVVVGLLPGRRGLGRAALGFGRRFDAVAEPRHGDRAVGVVERGDELGDRLRGIGRDAAVLAGVEVAVRPGEADREVRDAPQARDDGGPEVRRGGRVADEQDVRREFAAQARRHRHERGAAGLLLPLKADLDRRDDGGLAAEEIADAAEEREGLALVVLRTARIDASVDDGRLERRRLPGRDWIRGLDVVVPVDEHRRRAFGPPALGEKDGRRQRGGILRRGGRVEELADEAFPLQPLAQIRCAGDAVAEPRRIDANRREPKELEIFLLDGFFHGFSLSFS